MHNNHAKPVISTVLLNWNRADLLQMTVESYLNTITVPFEMFIIDNASTDDSHKIIDTLTQRHSKINAIYLPENIGGEAINVGLEMCQGALIHISENDLEYLPGWDKYVLAAFDSFPELGQLSLFAPVPTDEEVWVSKPSVLKHQKGIIIYNALENVGTSSIIRPEIVQAGIRFSNIVGENGVLFPNDGKFSYDVKKAGFMVAWAHHYLVKNVGHYGWEIQKRLDYYRRTYNGKNWLKVEKLYQRYKDWQQKIKPERSSWLFPSDPILPEKSEPSPECPETYLWSMFDGWTAEVETVEFIYSLVRLMKPRYVLETGTWHGFTAAAIGLALQKNGRGYLDTLEIDGDSVKVARQRIKEAGVEENVSIHHQSSLDFKPKEMIDFLLLDSALEIREEEFRHYLPWLKSNAVVIFHDTSPQHKVVREQIQKHLENGLLRGFFLNTPRGIAVFQFQKNAIKDKQKTDFQQMNTVSQETTPTLEYTGKTVPVCVAGMHRSGTSVLTHMLHEAGMYLGKSEDLMPPAPDNPEGFWENLKFVQVNDTLLNWLGGTWDNPPEFSMLRLQAHPDWFRMQQHTRNLLKEFQNYKYWGWKDPRNSLTLSFWQTIISEYRLLVPLRNPLAVALSLQKRNGFPLEKGLHLWQRYNEAILMHSNRDMLIIPYEKLIQDPKTLFTEIIKWLGWDIPAERIREAAALIKHPLNHNPLEIEAVFRSNDISLEIKHLYRQLLERSPFYSNQIIATVSQPYEENKTLNQEDFIKEIKQIKSLLENNEPQIALKRLNALVPQLPSDFEYWNEVGVLYFQLNDVNQALKAFHNAYQHNPQDVSAAKNLADLLFQLGKIENAVQLYQNIFNETPTDEDALIFAGKLAYFIQDIDGAEQIFWYVMDLNPENQVANENLEFLRENPQPETPIEATETIKNFVQGVKDVITILQRTPKTRTTRIENVDPKEFQKPCPACGSRATTRARFRADIVTCVDCGLTYLRTLPDQEKLKTNYDLYADEFSHMRLPENENDIKHSRLRRDYFLDEIQQFIKEPGNMLDVGCGWGAFLDAARERGFEVKGIEITPKAAEFARKHLNIPVDTRPLEQQKFPEKSFRLVTMNHVLEHLPQTRQTLEQVFRILEPGGIFAGMVPNFASFCSQMEGEYWDWLDPNFHYVHFTPETLRQVLENAGFVVERIYTAKGDYKTDRVKLGLLQKYGELSPEEFEAKIRELEAAGKGEEIRFIARKPEQPILPKEASTPQTQKGQKTRNRPKKRPTKKSNKAPVIAKNQALQFSIIIPVFNQVQYTRMCLEKIYQNTSPNVTFEVIVVDNASTDETPQYLEQARNQFPNLRIIRSEKNLKYAGGCNLGAQNARGEYLVFLNNDTEPESGWLESALKAFREEKNIGVLGAKLLYPDRTVQHCGIQFENSKIEDRFIWPDHRYRFAREDNPLVNRREDVHAVTGACLFIPKQLFRQVGGFDESYGMYFEDTDLCFKVKAQGKRVVYEPGVVVIHHEGKSTPKNKEIERLNKKAAKIFYHKWLDALVDIALDVLIDKVDGKYYYFSEFFYPRKVNRHTMLFLARMLQRLGNYYAFTGGIGDTLLFLSTFYDKKEKDFTVVCVPNNASVTRILLNNFPKITKVYFLPFPADGLWHFIIRGIWKQLPNCKGMGVTPEGDYQEEWTEELDIFKTYGVNPAPQWLSVIKAEKVLPYQVVIQPKGSTRGMVGSKRNIIRPRDWMKLQQILLANGIQPVIIGTPDEEDYYPILKGAINKRSYNLNEQMRLVRGADVFIGADSWGKTLAALNQIPTYVFKPPRGEDLSDWVDPSEYVFIRPWKSITLVEDVNHFAEAFRLPDGKKLNVPVTDEEYNFAPGQQPAPYFNAIVSANQVYLKREAGLGDVLMAFPLARALKTRNPEQKINFTSHYKYKHLVDANPYIDSFIPPEVYHAYLVYEPTAVDLNDARFGYAQKHQVDAFLEELDIEASAEEKQIELTVPAVARERVHQIMANIQEQYRRLGVQEWQKIVLLHPAKGDPNRTWPKENWEDLARRLIASGNLVITVGSNSASFNRGVHSLEVEGIFHLENELSSLEFVALCQQADVLVSTDSGPVQLAGATDIAIVGIYSVVRGANRLPYRHGKAGWNAVAVEPACPLKGCYEHMNDEKLLETYLKKIENRELTPAEMFSTWCLHTEKYACMKQMITVQQVWDALQPFLFNTVDADAILQKVEELVKQSDFVAAQKELEKWIRREDVDARILKRYVELLKDRGEWVQYVEWLETYVRRNPDDAVAVNELGVVRWQQNRKNEALNLFRSAVNLNGNHPDHVKNLADALLTEEQFEAAIQLYIYLIQKYPQDPEAYERLATLYIENGNYDDARLLLDRALQHNPDDAYLQTWRKLLEIPKLYLAYNFINQGELDIARQLLEEILTEFPDNVDALSGLGSILFHQGELKAARKVYNQILQLSPEHPESLFYLYKIALKEGDFAVLDELQQDFAAVFQRHPSLRKVVVERLLEEERFDEALVALDRYLGDFPEDADGYVILGNLFYEGGKVQEARRFYHRALELEPENEELRQMLKNLPGMEGE